MKWPDDYLVPGVKPFHQEEAGIIYCGDCREILPHLPKVDLCLTDPPYGINLGNNKSANENRVGYLKKQAYVGYEDTTENFKKIIVPALEKSIEISTRASIFGFAPGLRLLPEPTAMGGVYIPAGCGRNAWGFICFAPIFFYGSAPDLNLGAKSTAMKSTKMAEKNGHPVPKPIGWMKWLVGLGSRPGELILDPFLGSGTTAVAAKELGRKFIGVEISLDYCKIAKRRLQQCCVLPFDDEHNVKERHGDMQNSMLNLMALETEGE
jgi:DNA modification methylase